MRKYAFLTSQRTTAAGHKKSKYDMKPIATFISFFLKETLDGKKGKATC